MRTIIIRGLLLASLCLGAQAQASNLLFAGSDGFVDFVPIGTCCGESNNGFIGGPGRATAGLCVGNSTSTADPPASRAQMNTFTSVGALWFHANVKASSGATNNQQVLLIRSPDGVARILLRQTATFGTFKLSTRDSAGSITDVATATGALPAGTPTAVDLHVDYAGGAAQLYIGAATEVINFTGTLETDAATTLNQIELMSATDGNPVTGVDLDCSTPNYTIWSEVIVTDTQDTRDMILMPVNPAANGTTQNCSGGTAADLIDDMDATVVSSAANNQVCGFTTGLTFPSGTFNILGITQNARANTSPVGPQHLDFYMRVNATDNLAGLSLAPSLTINAGFSQLWSVNPHTSGPFAISDIAAGFNLGFKSLP